MSDVAVQERASEVQRGEDNCNNVNIFLHFLSNACRSNVSKAAIADLKILYKLQELNV